MNCKNCGAPIYGSKCEYCGSLTDSQEAVNLYADDKIVASVPFGVDINKEVLDENITEFVKYDAINARILSGAGLEPIGEPNKRGIKIEKRP